MRRIVGIIVHNWPLKLAAIGLATLMYGGLALSQNTQSFTGGVPVRVINQPPDTVLLAAPEPVKTVRYFAPNGVPVAASSFVATVDLEGVVPKDGLATAPIQVVAVDTRIRILGYDPQVASIPLEPLKTKQVDVRVEYGVVPDGLTLGETKVDPARVTVSGPESIIVRVVAVRADVLIQSAGLDIDQEVPLIPVDNLGNAISPVEVTPPTARVIIAVTSDLQSRTLPVNPIITGQPAAGFEIESVTVDPLVALVAGDADQLAELTQVDTDPIPLTGVSADEVVEVRLALPIGVVPVNDEPITVTIAIRPVLETRTFSAGLDIVGDTSAFAYGLPIDRVLITVGGSTADLDRLSGATVVATLDVTGLSAGVHDVPVTANLPTGTTLVAADPSTVPVTITAITPAAPSPSAGR